MPLGANGRTAGASVSWDEAIETLLGQGFADARGRPGDGATRFVV